MTEWPSQKNGPGRLDLLGIFPDDRYADCRDPLFFYFALYQSHGLIADASSGCQDNDIYIIFFQSISDLGCTLINQRK